MDTKIDWRDYILADPALLGGKPTLKGTRLSVEFVLGLLAAGWAPDEVCDEYSLTREQLQAIFAYAADVLQEDVIYQLPSAR